MADAPKRFRSFQEFWPYYVAEHSKRLTRGLHFVGTALTLGCPILALAISRWWPLLAMPITGYGFAWTAHFFVERNRPATFLYPAYSLVADFVMFAKMLTGKMG